jgi:hypothetical protein
MRTHHTLALAICLILALTGVANAQKLSVNETQALLAKGPWKIRTGGEYNYFIWGKSGTLCVKQYGPKDKKCADTGTWTRDGAKVCYKLQWWGKGIDQDKLCFQVVKTSKGYEAVGSSGLAELYFSVPDLR